MPGLTSAPVDPGTPDAVLGDAGLAASRVEVVEPLRAPELRLGLEARQGDAIGEAVLARPAERVGQQARAFLGCLRPGQVALEDLDRVLPRRRARAREDVAVELDLAPQGERERAEVGERDLAQPRIPAALAQALGARFQEPQLEGRIRANVRGGVGPARGSGAGAQLIACGSERVRLPGARELEWNRAREHGMRRDPVERLARAAGDEDQRRRARYQRRGRDPEGARAPRAERVARRPGEDAGDELALALAIEARDP